MADLTHIIRYRSAQTGKSWLDQHLVGETQAGVVDQLVGFGHGDRLEAVYALNLAVGEVRDVTSDVLHALAVHIETGNDELPGGVADAFARYDVPPPREWAEPEDAFDENDEHRLTASDLGLSRAA